MRRVTQYLGIMLVACVDLGGSIEASQAVGFQDSSPWVIEAADYTGEIKDQIARFEGRYTIRLLRDGEVGIPIGIQGSAITAIDIEKRTGEAHIVPCDGAYALSAARKGLYRVRVTFSSLMVQDSQFEGVQFRIPRATFSTLSLNVPRRDVELRQVDQLYVENHPEARINGIKLVARLGATDWVDLRWKTKPTAPVKVEPVLYGEVCLLAAVEEQLARLTSIIEYRMAQGETKELMIRLPADVNVLNVRGAGIEDWKVAEASGQKTLTVTLSASLKDAAYRLAIEAEQAIASSAVGYQLPEFQLVGVKQERGYLGVVRSGSVELSPETADGINRVDVKELPESLRSLATSPVTLAFKYHQHPYRATVTLTRHDDHPVLAAIAERGELVTVLSRQGELMTRATYVIKANKKQFLEVVLPTGATLWSCLVDERSVKPVEGTAHKLLVPLDASATDTETVSVELVYFEHRPQLTGFGRLMLEGPTLDVPTTVAHWLLYAPRDVRFLRMGGNLERGAAPLEFLENSLVQTAAAESEPSSSVSSVNGRFEDTLEGLRRRMNFQAKDGNIAAKASALAKREPASRQLEGLEEDTLGQARKAADKKLPSVSGDGGIGFGAMGGRDDRSAELQELDARLQERGILPLKIRLPKAGTLYQFNRLMTTQDALTMDTTFVRIQTSWLVMVAGLIVLPLGGMAFVRFRHS